MHLKLLFVAVIAGLAASAQTVARVANSETKGLMRGFSSSGDVSLQTMSSRVRIHHLSGKDELGNLVVVYDPKSRYYVWHLNLAQSLADTTSALPSLRAGGDALYVATSGMAELRLTLDLFVLWRSERATSLDAAEAASIAEIRDRLPLLKSNGYDPGYKLIEIANQIGPLWICPIRRPDSSFCTHTNIRLVSVKRAAETWRLVVQNRWYEEIVLDAKFNLVSTSSLPPGTGFEFAASPLSKMGFAEIESPLLTNP